MGLQAVKLPGPGEDTPEVADRIAAEGEQSCRQEHQEAARTAVALQVSRQPFPIIPCTKLAVKAAWISEHLSMQTAHRAGARPVLQAQTWPAHAGFQSAISGMDSSLASRAILQVCTCHGAKGIHPAGIAVFEEGHHSCPGKERLNLVEACRDHLHKDQHRSGQGSRELSERSHLCEASPTALPSQAVGRPPPAAHHLDPMWMQLLSSSL